MRSALRSLRSRWRIARRAPCDAAITIDLSYVDQQSRRSTSVSATGSTRPSTAIRTTDSPRPTPRTCTASPASRSTRRSRSKMVEQQVSDAETAIANGDAPEVAGDSYLYVGGMIGDLAITYDWCSLVRHRRPAHALVRVCRAGALQRLESGQGRNGAASRIRGPAGRSTIPANNYYYSFLEATMLLGARRATARRGCSSSTTVKIPRSTAYFAGDAGGGSQEGTGYGCRTSGCSGSIASGAIRPATISPTRTRT